MEGSQELIAVLGATEESAVEGEGIGLGYGRELGVEGGRVWEDVFTRRGYKVEIKDRRSIGDRVYLCGKSQY